MTPRFVDTSARRLIAAMLLLMVSLPTLVQSAEPAAGVKRVLIITGEDYPGHKWKETAPVVKEILAKDSRLEVSVLDDLKALDSTDLGQYASVVIHFKNYNANVPGEDSRKHLEQFVRDGGGMVTLHFGCGAFPGWGDFEKLAGRVYNPKLRAHDPHGKFMVDLVDREHPITKGMEPFETLDELYTCLDGQTPIHVLATAVSKVDQKPYPMAFVLEYGKGRSFHSPLGHDVRAFSVPGVSDLLRRATAWTAGLEPK
jgi:type 1 glutamine amidotransferase